MQRRASPGAGLAAGAVAEVSDCLAAGSLQGSAHWRGGLSGCPRIAASAAPRWLRTLPISLAPHLRSDTAQRVGEPAWHRRARRQRGTARTLLRVFSASKLLAGHHSSSTPSTSSWTPVDAMGRRWDSWQGRGQQGRDGDSWGKRDGPREQLRSGSRNSRSQRDGGDAGLRQECERLRTQLAVAERNQRLASDRTPHPAAREHPREGDWLCGNCGFGSNRYERQFCYRCTAPRCEYLDQARASALAASSAAVLARPPIATTSSSSCSPSVGTGVVPTAMPTYAAVAAAAAAGTSASTSSSPSSPSAPSPSPPTPSPQELAKSLRAKLDKLRAAKAALVGDSSCDDAARRIDEDISTASSQLAACLPVEVAVKGTIGTTASARQAVLRSEAKVARLEAQVTAIIGSYDLAVAELADNRAKLLEAETATARAAAIALPRSDVEAILTSDPGAVWAALMSFIQARVPGMPQPFIAHLDAATAAFHTACSQLPAAPAPGGDVGLQATTTTAPKADHQAAVQQSAAAPAQPHRHPAPQQGAHVLLQPSSPVMPSQFEATVASAEAAAAAASVQGQIRQQQLQQVPPQLPQAQLAAAASASPAQPAGGGVDDVAATAGRENQVGLQQLAAQGGSNPTAAQIGVGNGGDGVVCTSHGAGPAPPVSISIAGSIADVSDADLAIVPTNTASGAADDAMGGASDPVVVGKRSAADLAGDATDSVERARAIAARAKARAA